MHQLIDSNPFDLNNTSAYPKLRDKKLSDYPMSLDEITVQVKNYPITQEVTNDFKRNYG